MTTTTYPTLEQAVEAARQEITHIHVWCWDCNAGIAVKDTPFHDADHRLNESPCTFTHGDIDDALRAIAAAYVAVSELPDTALRLAALESLKVTYRATALAETTP